MANTPEFPDTVVDFPALPEVRHFGYQPEPVKQPHYDFVLVAQGRHPVLLRTCDGAEPTFHSAAFVLRDESAPQLELDKPYQVEPADSCMWSSPEHHSMTPATAFTDLTTRNVCLIHCLPDTFKLIAASYLANRVPPPHGTHSYSMQTLKNHLVRS